MKVRFKGNKGAVCYRGVNFVKENPVEVDPDWFERVTNPNIKMVRSRAPRKAQEEE